MRPIDESGLIYKIYPAEDERVLRVVRKIVRGLTFFHEGEVTTDARVWADVMRYPMPAALLSEMATGHRDPEVIDYRYAILDEGDLHSAWLLTFDERVSFIGVVLSVA
jgi:hypothetical protein